MKALAESYEVHISKIRAGLGVVVEGPDGYHRTSDKEIVARRLAQMEAEVARLISK